MWLLTLCGGDRKDYFVTMSLFTLWTCKGQPVDCSCSCYLQRWGLWDGILELRFIFCPVLLLKRLVLLSCPDCCCGPAVPSFCLPGWRQASPPSCLPENSGMSPSSFSKYSVLAILLSILRVLSHLVLINLYKVSTIVIPVFKMRKLRYKEVK